MFGSGMGDAFGGGDQGRAMEASFKEFLARPENRPILERHQRREVKQALQLREKEAALRFRDVVLEADYDAQVAVAPFLKNRVLRRVVQTFANDPGGDFGRWATNPRVLDMLREAQRAMEEGVVTEDEAEEYMLRALRDPASDHAAEFEAKTKTVARLPTDQLVGALNEHLAERRAGNEAYRAGDYAGALQRYERARSIVELVRGLSRADQAEVDANRVAVLCNVAAARLALEEYGAAAGAATTALEIDPGCVKALARRAKAHIGRHEYGAAAADVAALWGAGPAGAAQAAQLQAAMEAAKAADRRSDARTFGAMFDRAAAAAKK